MEKAVYICIEIGHQCCGGVYALLPLILLRFNFQFEPTRKSRHLLRVFYSYE